MAVKQSTLSWDDRIERADALAAEHAAAASLLRTFAGLLRAQHRFFDALRTSGRPLTGSIDRDLASIVVNAPPLLRAIESIVPADIADEGRALVAGGDQAIAVMARAGWTRTSGHSFLERMLLQPYAECLAAASLPPIDRAGAKMRARQCSFCGAPPQLSILHTRGDDDASGRQLLCSLCATAWPFRRLVCAHCGEEDERRLEYYQAAEFSHLRVDACETCRHYLKSVDLTRLGTAVPVVDEIAGAALDVWARDRGYEKVTLNLVGL